MLKQWAGGTEENQSPGLCRGPGAEGHLRLPLLLLKCSFWIVSLVIHVYLLVFIFSACVAVIMSNFSCLLTDSTSFFCIGF